ncbi:MAG: sigma-70 family RNA polymerase sigma factor [Myxococcota bacterium]
MTEKGSVHPEARALASELYAKHSQEILAFFRHTRRMTMADAGDLMQQTFAELLKTLRNNPQLKVEYPRALLFKIAHRQFGAYIEHKGRHGDRMVDEEIDEQRSLAESDDLQFQASLRADQKLLLRAMRRLTKEDGEQADRARERGDVTESWTISEHQLILYLRFWVGLTLARVAEILDIPPGTLSGRQRRALQLLRHRVAELEAPDEATRGTSTTMLERWHGILERDALEVLPAEPKP